MSCSFPASRLRLQALPLFLLLSLNLLPLAAQQVSPELLHGLTWRLIGPHRGGRPAAAFGKPSTLATRGSPFLMKRM
jgi:hypothetical protein